MSSTDAQTKRIADSESVTDVAQAAGDPAATRRLAAQNDIENLRMPGIEEIAVADGLLRNAPGFSAGFSAGVSASDGISASAAFNVQTAALSTSTGSVFAGLRLQASAKIPRPRTKLNLDIGTPPGGDIGIGIGTDFGPGGEITSAGGGSMSADVGINADFEAGITFEE
jgi:hypothetical protein